MAINWKKARNHFIISFIILIIGAGIGFFSCYGFIVGPSLQRVKQLRTELDGARENNIKLEESIRIRQETLNRASEIIRGNQSSINKLRDILKLLQEAGQNP
jgi:hypothetical protein